MKLDLLNYSKSHTINQSQSNLFTNGEVSEFKFTTSSNVPKYNGFVYVNPRVYNFGPI